MKKTLWILLSLLLVLLCMTAAVSCGDDVCEHEWSAWETKTAATCTAAGEQTRTCAECETTETQAIAALGHTGGTATCTAKAVCTTCNTAYGELLAHDWNAATCTAAKTCKNCSATEGNALGHTGGTATCTAKAVCTTCNTPYGEALGHTWTNANCTTPKTCSVCAATEGTALGHTWVNATCTTPKTCSVCAATEGTVLAHDWNAATCTAPKTCKNCPATEGEALGHTGERTTCNVQAICTRCHNPFGEAYGHVYNLKNTAAIYVKSAATCEAPASYYYSCACGEKSTESFTDGEALNHNYTYESNGDGTHTATCLNDPTHTKDDESCSGGEATCDTPAECAFCEEAYGEPAGHNWVADPAPLSGTSCTEDIRTNYTCSTCQATKTEIEDAPGHSYEDAVTPPTCAVPGYTTHTCTECGDSYTDTPVAATGAHDWDADRTCTTGHSCNDCGTTEPALGHSYNVSATPATCTAAAFDTFTCSVCDDEYTVVTADALGHNIAGVTPTEVSTEGCDYQQYYKCNTCGEDIKGDIVTRHKYVASVIDATCKTGGATVLTCSVCNDTQSTPIPADGTAHLWSTEGTKSGDKLIYECTVDGCDETKSVVDLSDKSEGELNVEDVTSNGVEFKDATMDVSQLTGEGGVLNGAEKVTLAAGKLEGSDLEDVKSNLDEKQLEQIGDNPIFNFTMTDADGNPISQFGDKKVTITVPYDPKTMGGDVDNIAIWFIADDGTLTAIEATYHNGFVTFQTNHFSRYTVTRLTPEERCALYGHNWATKAPVPATCTTAGYTLRVCIRCTLSEKYDIVDALGHSYVEASTEPAGCTTAGKIVYDCENCSHSYETAIPATGHSYVSETVPATCADFGTTTYTCGNCADRYTETLPNLSHEMDSEITAPTCEESGYTTYFCVNCSYYYNGDYTKALGHSLVDTWEWTDNESATVTLSCDREGCEHVFTEEVAATSKTWSSTCKKEGRTVYTAKYVYNGVTYTDTQTVPLPLANHEYDTTKLLHDANGHWYRCGFCGAAGEAQAHVWNAGTVTKAPTCVAKGEKTFTCECGEIKTEEIPVTTTHRYTADNVCQDCGHKFVCEHTYNAGEIISQSTCAVAGAKRFTCTKCGATKTEALPLDESTHVWNSGEITTAPTCAAEGVKTFTCSVCNGTKTEAVAIDANAHAFGEGVITTAPTCVAAGVKTFTCTHNSAHTKTEAVAATGEHTYADGKCTQCGKIETACDHSELTRTVVVDLSKHGVCGGTLSYLTCECGEIAVLTEDMFEMMEGMALGCEHITQSNETEGEDEDGNEFGSVDFSCADCGLVVTATFTEIVDGCRGIDRLSLLFKVNGTAIMPEIVCEEVWEEHDSENYETEIIDLTKYGACGGTLEIMKCGDCGATIDLEKPAAPDCTGEWIEIMPENESGEYKLYFACTECGLVIDVLAKAQTVNCQRFMIAEFMISCGDTVIFELEMKQSMGYTEHNWVGSAELAEGKTCEDGFVLTLTCADCGTSFTYSYNEHMPAILDREIDLTEHGACEGSIKFYTCPCGAYEDVYVDSCANYNGSNSYEDEDGTPHYVYIYSCEKCGLAYMEGYSYLREGCTENEYYFIAVGIGEETVILEPYTYLYSSYEDHNYLYEFELEGDSCEDGFTYTATCVDCGAVDAGSGTQHSPVLTAYYDLAKHDACGGYIEIHSCACGKEGWMNFEIPCDYSQDSHVYEGTDGYLHDVSTYTCQKCGLSFTTDSYAVPEGCYAIHYTTLTISVGENVVEEGYTYVSEHEDRHDYEYEFELYGESCEDGYFYTATCKVCGYTESGENYWHQAFDQAYYDLTEYGICGGYIAIYACACGEESGSKREVYSCDCTYETSSYNKDGIEHSVETRTCQKCGMVYVEDRYLVPDGCCEYVYTTITIKKDDVTVIKTVEFNDGWYDHHEFEYEFELMGESCEDGVHLYGYCKVCGEYKNFYRDWHDYEHGVCTLCGAPAPECEHLWMEGDISAPTCSENGVATYTCAYCGDTMTETVPATGEHTYEDGACTQCGKAEPECEHQFDEGTVTLAPTCTTPGTKFFTCELCGETKSESIAIDKDAHAFDEGKVTTAPTCVASGIKTYTCTVCGETKTEAVAVDANAHTWVDATCEAPKTCSVCKATEGEALGHTWVDATCEAPKTCKNCSATEGEALGHTWVDTVTAPTCTEAGYTTHVCSACDKTVTDTPIPATGNHTYENGACTQCGKAEPECEHQFDEGTVTLKPTCVAEGAKLFTCAKCGETKSESIAIDKDAHAFDEGKVTTEPTCVASGIKTYTCALCAETKTESVDIDKDAHAFDEGKVTTAPTCVASGIKTYTCALCAETKTESVDIDKDAHAFDEGKVTTAPTCVASGIKTYTCALCAETKTEAVAADANAHTWVDATCEAPKTCSVCKATEGEALGHTWVDATCEAPKTCSVCGATEGEALGHAWVDATCEGPKTCSVCGATEGEALGHTWVDTVTAPTCTEAGYTTHVCSACNKTVTDTPIPATGNHTYENGACTQCGKAEPECEHQFDEGTVTLAPTCTTPGTKFFTCELCGETKSESIAIDKDAHAFDEGKVTTAPTCVASGIKTYTCALCAETKTESVDIDKDAHAWNKGEIATAPTCSVEGVMVFTCQLCDEFKTEAIAVNKNAHEWNEGEITLAPTCAADGVMTYTCASCGESKTEIVPATGEHTYEDGACTQCGKVEGACDHSKLTRTVTVDFAEFGACGGVFSYLTCDCGEIAVLTVDSFDLLEEMHMPCNDHIVVDEEKEWEDEDGNEYWSRTAHCEKCGMVQIMTEVEIEEDCLEIERMTIQFLMDDTPVMPKLVMEYVEEYHHYENYESEIIDLTEYGACGGTLEIMKCGDCGMLMGMDEPNAPNCKGEWIEDMQETADGVEYVMYFACTECGLVIDAGGKMYVENCETVMVSTVLVTCGDTVIFELEMKQSMGYAEHEWVVSAELAEGKSCEDGYLLTSTCPNCGISLTFSYNEHMTFIRNTEKEIDLTEFGACEGSIQFYTCPCGEVETAEIDCCAHEGMGNSYEDENGNRHDMFVYTCSKCGLAYMEDRYTVREGCSRIVYYTYAVAMGESIVVEEFTVAGGSYEDHNYLYEFTLNGDSCEDGFTYTATCADCGAVRTGSGKYHNPYLTAYYDLSEYGICGGSIEIHSCACGKESWTNTDIACETTWDSTSYEKDGVLHQVDTRVCRKCGMTYVRDTYQVSEGCYLINHATLNITVGETEVIKDLVYVDGRESRHDYEYEVEMDGASCEDGYYYYATCKVCGETDSGYNKWHDSQFYYAYYDLAEYGACGGYIEYRSCACGAQSALIDDVACEYESEITPYEKDGVLHALQTVICRTCGLTITTDAYQVQEGCYESIYGTITIKVGEQTVVENLECVMFREENHDYEYTFELMGDSCEDGLRYQRICKTCGYGKDSSAFTYSHETFPTNSIDLAEYGACGGSIDFYACPCGKLSRVESNFECELQYCDNKLETDEDGIEHWVETATCANCGLQYVRDDYTVREGCVDIRYRTISVTVGENVVLEPYKFAAERIANHTYEYRFEMYGESCEDGYVAHISCKNCDYSRTEEFRGHKTYESYHDLTKYGACGGYIRMRSCPCGENGGYPDYSFACNFSEAQTHTYVGEDGFTHTVSTWVCEDCGLTRTEDHYTVKEGCNLVNYRTMTVTVDGITVVDLDGLRSWQELHEYDYNFIMQGESCEDGYTYTRTCKNCDYYEDRTWETYYYHQNFPTKYYDFSQYSACGSYLYEYACPCGQYNGISTNFYSCDLSYEWDNYTDDSGVSHEVEISTCQKCGLVFTRDRYAVREGCFDVYYCALTVTSGDVTLLDNLFYKERSEERHQSIYELTLNEGATSCEDGYTVVEKCAKCGYASEPWENSGWHTSYCVEYYDLAPYTACGGYVRVMSCACGETHYFDHNIYCEFESEETEYKDADGRKHTLYTNTCTACGLVWEQDHYTVREGCFDVHYVEYTFTVDGTAVISALKNVDGRSERHEYDYTFHLNGKSCNDGYTYVAVCKSCDYSREGEGSWHTTYTMETYYLAEHGACGGYLERYTCACGESSGISWNIECDYEYEETSFEENGVTHDVYTYTCAACGLKLVENWYTLREGCYDNTYVEMTVTVGDTVVVDGMKARNDYDTYHKLAYTFQLNDGVSCENGYTYVATCQNCDYVTDGSGSSHNTYTTERYDLAEYGACGGEISLYTCACGKSKGVWSNLNCHYNSSTVENVVDGITHSVTTYVCNNCALVRVYDAYTVREGCYYVTYYALTVKVGDNVPVNNYEYVYNRSECHDYTYSFTVGASCEDGYSYTAACKNCGDTREGGGYGHNTYRTQYYFLEDYGVCGGYVQYYTCACGYSSRISTSFDCDYTSSNSSYEDANGVTHSVDTYACADCGMTRVSDYHTVTEGCYDIRYCDFTLVMGEETVVDTLRYVSSRSSNHDLSYTLTLKDGATTCVDGYVASFRCKNCDYTGTEYGYSHNSYPIERYNLKDFGACGGYVEIRECACGENSYVNTGWHCNTNYTSNTYVDEDGYTHRVSTSTCNSCEMRYTEDSYAVKAADSCETTTYHTVMMNVGGTLVCDYRYTTTDTVHDYKVTGTTEDGVTCENGVTLTYECRYCDHSYTNHYTYHAEYELERVALDCDCGGYAAIRGCACGYYVSLDLSNWLCDEGWTYTDAFVDNIVPEDYYRVPNGNRYIDNEFGIYTCAVTDPVRCAYKIRVARYYVMEGDCRAAYCVKYQFGYDEETGTCDYEYTLKTTQLETVHTFTETEISENENGLIVTGTKYTCENCGSYYYEKNYYDAALGKSVKNEYYFENKLDDGNYAFYHTVTEYDYTFDAGFGVNTYAYTQTTSYPGYSRVEKRGYTYYREYNFTMYEMTVYNRGTADETWSRYDYTYSFEGSCTRTTVFTNSAGTRTESTEEYHRSTTRKTDKNSTCTQDGAYHDECVFCEKTTYEGIYNPNGHSWVKLADEYYVCGHCGLENTNGVSGSIVMEDLTRTLGNGENYVVGYWNKTLVKFQYYVCLYLNEPNEYGDYQVDLTGITVNKLDGTRGYAFSKAEVAAAAKALGYEADEYDVMFVFVPEGADSSFDYAIIFSEDEAPAEVSESTAFTTYLETNEIITITIKPAESGMWTFRFADYHDTYIQLLDAEGNFLTSSVYGAYMEYELTAGETYQLQIKWATYYDYAFCYIGVGITAPDAA